MGDAGMNAMLTCLMSGVTVKKSDLLVVMAKESTMKSEMGGNVGDGNSDGGDGDNDVSLLDLGELDESCVSVIVNVLISLMSTLVFAVSYCALAHLTVNHGLVTVLPHMTSLTRAGVTTSRVTSKAMTLDCEKVYASGPGDMSLCTVGLLGLGNVLCRGSCSDYEHPGWHVTPVSSVPS